MKKLFLVRRIVGGSMLPLLMPGKVVLAYGFGKVKAGDVVILVHDGIEKIKRVDKIDGEWFYVLGDNAGASTDSRQFGAIGRSSIIAKVIWPRAGGLQYYT